MWWPLTGIVAQGIVLVLLGNVVGGSRIWAQEQPETLMSWQQAKLVIPPPKRKAGSLTKSRLGQERSSVGSLALIGLVPPSVEPLITVAERPVFWFYVSQACPSKISGCSLRFELVDEQETQLFTQSMQWPPQAGLLRVKVPDSIPPLESNKQYRWRLRLLNSQGDYKEVIFDDFKHLAPAPALVDALATATTPRVRYKIYGAHNAWYEMLTELIEQYTATPQKIEVNQDWQKLLSMMKISCTPLAKATKEVEGFIPFSCIDVEDAQF